MKDDLHCLTMAARLLAGLSTDEDRAEVLCLVAAPKPDPDLAHIAELIRRWVARSSRPDLVLAWLTAEAPADGAGVLPPAPATVEPQATPGGGGTPSPLAAPGGAPISVERRVRE